ncbi:FmdB family zinc ribbon protein [Botrimarina mediterranea]|uniref:Zinc ribbon domain protein n=1 Tax=Botrimarina mediterranea TaxID=2528022 RepID=A0A518K3J8_9BACT|nr:zinc ribbon domain-containing protein [Botrimarina mediterranea]QDV72376.1 Zinc ribbon domain protein [Botrimarina mediterranea]QDV76922.1 Zinc ribbon domain protein [Planctomycetes bacterium K2D]
MPLYEYQCKDCDRDVEVLVRSEAEKPECPECGSGRLVKLLSVCASPTTGSGPASLPTSLPSGGGGCGGGCACHPRG